MIRITSKVDGYRRCGVLHPARPVEYEDTRFSAEELAVLRADPLLDVEVIEEPEVPEGMVLANLDPAGFEDMTLAQLKQLARDMGLEIPDRATKKQLIEMIAREPVLVEEKDVEGS